MSWSLGYNDHDYETDRYSTVTMGGNEANGLLESETDANEINAGVEFGYDMTMNALTIGPRFAFRAALQENRYRWLHGNGEKQ
jgi:uncharacterized protein YhjY with autotransporter beta-barrel domain